MKNYRITKEQIEIQGKMYHVARAYVETPKGKYMKEKNVFAYRFHTEEAMEQYLNEWQKKIEAREKDKEERKAKKMEAKRNLTNPFRVGDILYDSWGWEQTNIDFFQVVEIGPKSVVLQQIAENNEGECGFLCEHVTAKKDCFIGDPFTKLLQVTSSGEVYVPSRHGCISKWDGKKLYQSHYA